MLTRRETLLGCLAGSALVLSTAGRAGPNGQPRTRTTFPPFELQADAAALAAVASGLKGYAIVPSGGDVMFVWLKDDDGRIWILRADGRDLQFKFEVFALSILSLGEMKARLAAWRPPELPDDVPEELRRLLITRPRMPEPPTRFEPWPVTSYQCEVLRREDYIADVPIADAGLVIGSDPVLNSGGRRAPPEAIATCEVAAGLLFTGANGDRLLAAVDWTPTSIIWTREAGLIDAYLGDCERIDLATYRHSRRTAP